MRIRLYVGVVVALAAIAAVVAGDQPGMQHRGVWLPFAFAGIIAMSELLQVRYHHRHQIDALNLLEGVTAPLVFAASGEQVMLAVAAGTLLAGIVGGNSLLKAVFNSAQWVLAAAVGTVVFHAMLRIDAPGDGGLIPIAVGVAAMGAVNLLTMSGVLHISAGAAERRAAPATGGGMLAGHVVSLAGNITAGVCLTAAFHWSAWLLGLAVGLVVAVHRAVRAMATVRADGRRLEGLQRATHALVSSIDGADALPTFLAEARSGFEVRAVELVLFDGDQAGATTHRSSAAPAGVPAYTTTTTDHPLAVLLRDLREPQHLHVGSDPREVGRALAERGHAWAIAVPLRDGDDTVGLLLFYDRIGISGFEDGELRVGIALARELVGFLQRVALIGAIDGERRKLADILDSTSDGIVTISADGMLTSWNRGFAAITGYQAEEMVGTRHIGLLRPRDADGRDVQLEHWMRLHANGASLPTELQVTTADGRTAWLSCSYSHVPASADRCEVLVVVARNVTQARELERLKDDFVAVVSHELRTPLVPIKGWAQTLLNRGDRLSEDQRRTAVQAILSQAQKLESLVLNILESARIEAGRDEVDGLTDVGAVTERLVDDLLLARPDRQVRLQVEGGGCLVAGSAVWVERAVANLVANAVKYSPDSEPVDVAVLARDGEVVVAVTDRGPGVAPEAQERIFQRFERLEESRTQTGTGLGLYITRRLARTMGGDVGVTSTPGLGSTFMLRLPQARPGATAMPEQRTEEPHEPPRVVRVG